MTSRTDTALVLTRFLAASPERVFRAWTTPDELRRWACPEGASIDAADVDLRVGGGWRIEMRGPDGQEYTAFGTYREIDPPRRLVYTWDWEQAEHRVGETVVTLELRALDGGTEAVLTHGGFPDADRTEGHRQGWVSCLDRLARLLS